MNLQNRYSSRTVIGGLACGIAILIANLFFHSTLLGDLYWLVLVVTVIFLIVTMCKNYKRFGPYLRLKRAINVELMQQTPFGVARIYVLPQERRGLAIFVAPFHRIGLTHVVLEFSVDLAEGDPGRRPDYVQTSYLFNRQLVYVPKNVQAALIEDENGELTLRYMQEMADSTKWAIDPKHAELTTASEDELLALQASLKKWRELTGM